MKEVPILFSTPMVQALLGGTKTMTRRIVKPKSAAFDIAMRKDGSNKWPRNLDEDERFISDMVCPYGQPGDILWVKETFYAFGHWTTITEKGKSKRKFMDLTRENCYLYQFHAEWKPQKVAKFGELGWHKRPALFMRKDHGNLKLKVTNVRVERLQDITQEESIQEGIFDYNDGTYKNYFTQKGLREKDGVECLLPKGSFESLWCSINGLKSWEENPWVWVIEFERIAKP